MIKSLTLTNFQPHADSKLEFCPGVNAIVGGNDEGKTSTLRALDLVINNRPRGEGFIRDFQDFATVRMEVINSGETYGVERHRNKKKGTNLYTIIPPEGDPIVFTAFGSEPPGDVSSILRMSDLNLQDQYDPYFLVTHSPGQVATYIREHADLEIVDQVVSKISGKIKDIKAEFANAQLELTRIDGEIFKFKQLNLSTLEDLINQYKILDKKRELTGKSITDLKEWTVQWETLVNKLDRIPKDLDQVRDSSITQMSKVSSLNGNLRQQKEVIDSLGRIRILNLGEAQVLMVEADAKLNNQKDLRLDIDCLQGILKTWEAIRPRPIEIDVGIQLNSANKKSNRFVDVESRFTNLNRILNTLTLLEKSIAEGERNITEKSLEVRKLREQLKDCPHCGSRLTPESKVKLLEN